MVSSVPHRNTAVPARLVLTAANTCACVASMTFVTVTTVPCANSGPPPKGSPVAKAILPPLAVSPPVVQGNDAPPQEKGGSVAVIEIQVPAVTVVPFHVVAAALVVASYTDCQSSFTDSSFRNKRERAERAGIDRALISSDRGSSPPLTLFE